MTLCLSRLRLSRKPSTQARDAILNQERGGPRLDVPPRLFWPAFADLPGRTRDFPGRKDRLGAFLHLSARPPAPGAPFEPPEAKALVPDLREGDPLAFALRTNATRAHKGSVAKLGLNATDRRFQPSFAIMLRS